MGILARFVYYFVCLLTVYSAFVETFCWIKVCGLTQPNITKTQPSIISLWWRFFLACLLRNARVTSWFKFLLTWLIVDGNIVFECLNVFLFIASYSRIHQTNRLSIIVFELNLFIKCARLWTMFESIFTENSSKPFYKLLPQNETNEWNNTGRTNKITNFDEMTDINLSTMEFTSYSVSKYYFKKKVDESIMIINY